MRKANKFRLYPTKQQEKTLFWTLTRCRELYNAALAERKEAYRMAGKSITYYEQKRDLPEIKAELREEYQQIHSQVLQDVLLRLKRAFDAFFSRVENGEEPGYPGFRAATATTRSPIPRGATASRMIAVCASRRLAPSRSRCIARWKAPLKPAPSSMRQVSGMLSSRAR